MQELGIKFTVRKYINEVRDVEINLRFKLFCNVTGCVFYYGYVAYSLVDYCKVQMQFLYYVSADVNK